MLYNSQMYTSLEEQLNKLTCFSSLKMVYLKYSIMKITLNINEDQKDLVFNLLNSNNLDFEVEEDFDIPQWQLDETRKRVIESEKNPEIMVTWEEVNQRLEKRL